MTLKQLQADVPSPTLSERVRKLEQIIKELKKPDKIHQCNECGKVLVNIQTCNCSRNGKVL